MLVILFASFSCGAFGHGTVTNPAPRAFTFQGNLGGCQWCSGEKKEGVNPPGQVVYSTQLSTPCMGTNRGDPVISGSWSSQNQGPKYDGQWGPFNGPYIAGQSFEAKVLMNANHQGDAQWQFCPHSEPESDACFRKYIVKDWEGVNCHFNDCGAAPHKHNAPYSETVTLPSDLPTGPGTLRWYWVCKETVEVFTSCIDVDIQGGGPPTPAPPPDPNTVIENAPGVGTWGGSCTCPNGAVYEVGASDSCNTMHCEGGEKGTCNKSPGPWAGRKVVCAAAATDAPTGGGASATAAPTGGGASATVAPASCQDSNAACAAWAAVGECANNPEFMNTNCCSTCSAGGAGGAGNAALLSSADRFAASAFSILALTAISAFSGLVV